MPDPTPTPQLSPFYNVLIDLEPAIKGVAYKFTPENAFRKIDSVEEMQLVYWSEMLQRMHVCASTSVKRIKKWLEAVQSGYEADNYYGLCSAIRGLVEACADTFYAVAQIIDPVCMNFAVIEQALRGEAKGVLLSEQIENVLIHYVFARKLTKPERSSFPPEHEAEQVRTYLESLANPQISDLYSELCQVSHPSAISFLPFLMGTEEYPLIMHDEHVDRELNDDFLDRHKSAILTGCSVSVIPAMCILRLINEFDAPITEALRTDELALQPATESEFWEDMVAKIESSKEGNVLQGVTD
jgi:hypothetical protein